MFRYLAEGTTVPVVVHLDHGYTTEECRVAIGEGFTSVMFDGSRKPLDENIAETAAIAEMADRVIHLSGGRIAEIVTNALRKPAHDIVW